MSRQLGSALGVAILVAIIGNPAPGDVIAVFRDAWLFIPLTALAAGAVLLSVGPVRIGSAVPASASASEEISEAGVAGAEVAPARAAA
jgi:hypothetical protein